LFACFHPAARPSAASAGVVMCSPLFGELVQQHRMFHRIAQDLAGRGIPTVRFDWFGTGDSAGDLDGASVERWSADLQVVIGWLRRQLRSEPLVVLGSGVGGTLASRAAAADPGIVGVALCQGVVDGGRYVDDLLELHCDELAPKFGGRPDPPGATELLGFAVPDHLIAQLRDLHLRAAVPRRDQPVLVVGSPDAVRPVSDLLAPLVDDLTVHAAAVPPGWQHPDDGIYDVLVPPAVVRPITAWVADLCAALATSGS